MKKRPESLLAVYSARSELSRPDDSLTLMSRTRLGASATKPGINRASGKPLQYFFGISERMALSLRRAGLKTLA